MGIEFRIATHDDLDLLTAIAARFGRGPLSDALQGWLDPEWDLGWIAMWDGQEVGAAWWRVFRANSDRDDWHPH